MPQRKDIPLAQITEPPGGAPGEPACEYPGCREAGRFRAPRSRDRLGEYHQFCLEHVRAYNAAWDYFRGMSQGEIERFRAEAVFGHRPTWPFGALRSGKAPWEAAGETSGPSPLRRPTSERERRALATLDLPAGVGLQEVKARYKQLVKRFHPDANGGAVEAEERFKVITEAYSYLMGCGYA
ncbi:MAG: J domain-containing protein [Alphaproteobacteria bacterium]|nr:J domain-containing protein [Alphaproteobacteria bacterium]